MTQGSEYSENSENSEYSEYSDYSGTPMIQSMSPLNS